MTTAANWGVAIKVDGTDQTDWYLHIESHSVNAGWHVTKAQAVALSDTTPVPGGPSPTGPHLHFEVQTGQLDVYATSLDPVPLLAGTYGASGGIIVADMTPDEHKFLYALFNLMNAGSYQDASEPQTPWLTTTLAALAAKPAGSVTVDNASVLAALSTLQGHLDVAAGDIATVKRLVEKDLAP